MSVQDFDNRVAKMPLLFARLKQGQLLNRGDLTAVPERGVYVYYDGDKPIYVGRSNRLRERVLEHGRPSSTHNSAPFAFNLAKERAKGIGIDVGSLSRGDLEKDGRFVQLFTDAKARVRRMQFRVVEIADDPIGQTLFEVYAALALETRYNDFDTH